MQPTSPKTPVSGNDSTKSKEVAPFLKNLRKMLEEESDDVLRWTTNGRAFEIHDMERMMSYVLPKYFKHRKYTSFQRQLNYFNFKKWTKSKAVVCTFSNEYFLRDQPELAWRISRKKSMHSSSSKSSPTRKLPSLTPPRKGPMSAFGEWKSDDMAIKVPVKSEHFGDSFPSPTDMDMMLSANEVDFHRFYTHRGAMPTGDAPLDSLDWIDTFLPSLEVPTKMDDTFYPGAMAVPFYLRGGHHMSYQSLPPPSDFGCVQAAL
ncbi:hypothetical protein Poli38472_005713 [Pythium oligandrum]|uniref:HSF-type DNA-binding domain-containing protein n=1 Tax=Pythium oligandrum TaxID=41045 RepID=A0A8K1CRK1_PYTOL|nr:hypothetical protein Poli38472_005713 [Pythium oligandrum]|eukprot:TMW68245.1 hypothetical protein Poli38472_005713 [Pythium oligandrum]